MTNIGIVLSDMLTDIVNFLPNIVNAVILLIIGFLLGKLIGRVVKEILRKARFDYYITETEKPPISLTNIFSTIIRWWIYLVFITDDQGTRKQVTKILVIR